MLSHKQERLGRQGNSGFELYYQLYSASLNFYPILSQKYLSGSLSGLSLDTHAERDRETDRDRYRDRNRDREILCALQEDSELFYFSENAKNNCLGKIIKISNIKREPTCQPRTCTLDLS